MFRYYETYYVNVVRYFNEDTLKDIANDYKDYLEKRQYEDDENSFDDFVIDTFDNEFSMLHDYDFEDSNSEELYKEVKKYM
jgi:hypothetical protein